MSVCAHGARAGARAHAFGPDRDAHERARGPQDVPSEGESRQPCWSHTLRSWPPTDGGRRPLATAIVPSAGLGLRGVWPASPGGGEDARARAAGSWGDTQVGNSGVLD